MKRVLVTRPEPGASETAARLAALGLQPIKLPLTEIRPRDVDNWPGPSVVDAIALASANAARHAPKGLIAEFAGKPTFAVGPRTAKAAGQAGLTVVDASAGDAEGLAGRIAAALPAGSRVLVLCGRVRRNVLEERLGASGFLTEVVETYDTLVREFSDQALLSEMGKQPIDAVLLHSANGARQFRHLIDHPVINRTIANATIFCMSHRVASALGEVEPARLKIATQPTEEGVFAAIKAHVWL